MNNLIRVVVAIIRDKDGKILITQRMADRIQPNLWEFPGGKITLYETGLQALKREIFEEVDIKIEKAMPFMQIYHDYKNYSVWLDIWQVEKYSGTASGKEGQNIAWVDFEQLNSYDFLEANKHIFKALRLPNFYLKMQNHYKVEDYLNQIDEAKTKGFEMIELSATNLSPKDYKELIKQSLIKTKELNLRVLLTGGLEKLAEFEQIDGVCLPAGELHKLNARPVSEDKLFCIWCKDMEDIKLAELLEADFVVLYPLLKDNFALGWNKFQQLANSTNLPIYVAGGLDKSMFARVRALGGIGCVLEQ